MEENHLKNFEIYLLFITAKLNNFFEKQKPYIFCTKGCGKCCKNATFPYSEIEVKYLLNGFKQLSDDTKKEIKKKVAQLVEDKKNFNGEKFLYDCPFLINNVCSVYPYRGLICRIFGLMVQSVDKKTVDVPFCCFDGLNYSNVIADDGKNVSPEKFKNLGIEEVPTAFNISYNFLTDPDFAKGFKFEFGNKKTLLDLLIEDGTVLEN